MEASKMSAQDQVSSFLKEGESVVIEGVNDSAKAYLIAKALKKLQVHTLVVTASTSEENALYHDLSYFLGKEVLDLPAWETLPSEGVPPSSDVVGERMNVLYALKEAKEPEVLLCSLASCLQKVLPPSEIGGKSLLLEKGETVSFQEFFDTLLSLGYQKLPLTTDKGEFSSRGGLVDLFPPHLPDPYRVEFFGDRIESIRTFDPVSQRSIEEVSTLTIHPAKEMELMEHGTPRPLTDYLGENYLVVFDDLLEIEDAFVKIEALLPKSHKMFMRLTEFIETASRQPFLYFTTDPLSSLSDVSVLDSSSFLKARKISFSMFGATLKALHQNPMISPLSSLFMEEDKLSFLDYLDDQAKLLFLCSSQSDEEALRKKLSDRALKLPLNTKFERGYLTSGFILDESQTIFFPTTELSGSYKIRRQKLRSSHLSAAYENHHLEFGDFVVHDQHGIGKYFGVEKKTGLDGVEKEFFVIEYQEKAKLFVPLTQSSLVSKYIGAGERAPSLHKIGSSKWASLLGKTQKAIACYAADLLKNYAKREIYGGFAYPENSEEVLQFYGEFPFEETKDQLMALSETIRDMESKKAMDRLICGDVGYGKTEVAMRAAFKAVLAGQKQVAVLVPTTVLAMQHYESFCERMQNYPISIEVLSRAHPPKKVKQILDGLRQGSVDIVIGTHRIVSKDVSFKDLGLVVIDEEQRFGVRAKEHLKKIKAGVDCLTLSATPIPRTLYMSLVGVRDMSVIATPPHDRVPVKSILCKKNDLVIKEAIQRELARGGQVFFIHNRVESIDLVTSHLQKLVPTAKIAFAHGQMHPGTLDHLFHAFKKGDIDVLVSTTIVENGIDIPNANTILIDKADTFGLAELYQLRGRVGRWNRRAYAYFLLDRSDLSEISKKRLLAIKEASGYGGGMKLAMRDLEIRGAGDLLGEDQSGHVSSIGFHLYCKLLKKTIKALKGEIPKDQVEAKMEFSYDAKLPEDFVNDASLRQEIYHRLGSVTSQKEVDAIFEEVKDRFGPLPHQALFLYHLFRIKIFAESKGISRLSFQRASLQIELAGQKNKSSYLVKLPPFESPAELEERALWLIEKAVSKD